MLSAAHTWSLTAIAIAVAFAMLWAFRQCSDQTAIRIAKRKIHAHLLAFRLYGDEPSQVFRAQKQLLIWNLRYLALMLRPTAVTILPLALLLFHMDAIYGHRALQAGEATLVTAEFAQGFNLRSEPLRLTGSGIAVETPTLRLPGAHQACWRVRALSETTGSVSLQLTGASALKLVQSGAPLGYVAERRERSLPAWLLHPRESRLGAGPVDAIAVEYPPARVPVFGFGLHWLVWFCLVSFIAMLSLRRRLRVTF